ncbi:hypothetical protein AAFF_G00161410 [Aldrovandia affinis]|uniref:Uncharacterized protein n=1 Tax=Aldrovandia affinis TaxID=143900 RepID=A0AAD7RMM2_9TELE|nr:hypothetical protein AAFF_G00161410 [Aldrovandia affinis]
MGLLAEKAWRGCERSGHKHGRTGFSERALANQPRLARIARRPGPCLDWLTEQSPDAAPCSSSGLNANRLSHSVRRVPR